MEDFCEGSLDIEEEAGLLFNGLESDIVEKGDQPVEHFYGRYTGQAVQVDFI